jgi:hypothetical protein
MHPNVTTIFVFFVIFLVFVLAVGACSVTAISVSSVFFRCSQQRARHGEQTHDAKNQSYTCR